ncbi:aminopeptidase [Oceanicola sp. 22II-s10i]|nr:aminopeptidase [Oceanicola sp. 22II-s10i]
MIITAAVLALGALGGFAAKALGMPLPFMLGALLSTSIMVVLFPRALPADYKTPVNFRGLFIALIGLSIGAQVTWQVLGDLVHAIPTFILLTGFVPLVLWVNYMIFRKIGGYDPPTAYFSSTPGGLVEAMLMGEQAGADERLVAMQQFLRIIMVVTMVPVGLSIYYGHPVGSAAGMTFSRADAGLEHFPEVIVLVVIGFAFGKIGHLPAGQFVGPMIVGMIASLSGMVEVEVPGYMINAAQVVIGALLGTRFNGMNIAMILRGSGLSVMSVGSMLLIGCICSAIAKPLTGEPFDVLLISFSPGGVTEMALIALSLQANPAFVSVHHIYRIVLTIIVMTWGYRRYLIGGR